MSKNCLNDYVGHIIEAAQLACTYMDGMRNRIAQAISILTFDIVWDTV